MTASKPSAEGQLLLTPPPRPPSLTKSTGWNLIGSVAPALIAFLAIPLMIGGLGDDRFGVLTLAWVVIGYFAIFDLGVGRATTYTVAKMLGANERGAIGPLLSTAILFSTTLGAIFGVVTAASASLFANRLLDVPAHLVDETRVGLLLLALVLPFDMAAVTMRSAIEARGRFDLTNKVRLLSSASMYIGPLVVLPFTSSLAVVLAVLVLTRIVASLITLVLCRRVFADIWTRLEVRRASLGPVLRTGGWMNLGSLVYPLMMMIDRFLIGALISVAAVTWYATPYELATRVLWTIPVAVTAVLFPDFSANLVPDRARATSLFAIGSRFVFLGLFPLVLTLVMLGHALLALWLDPAFADHSGRVTQVIVLSLLITGMSNIPQALVQAAGRANRIAWLQLAELPFYIGGSILAAMTWGIVGVAAVGLVRGVVDTIVLYLFANRELGLRGVPIPTSILVMAGVMLLLGFAVYDASVLVQGALLIASIAIFLPVYWSFGFGSNERAMARHHLASARALVTRMVVGRFGHVQKEGSL